MVVDVDGRVVTDTAAELAPGTTAPFLGGRRATAVNLATNDPVGHVYVDVDLEVLATDSRAFPVTLLYITGIGGLLTVGVGDGMGHGISVTFSLPLNVRLTRLATSLRESRASQYALAGSMYSISFCQRALQTGREAKSSPIRPGGERPGFAPVRSTRALEPIDDWLLPHAGGNVRS
ncbi:MAG: hypothetical protein OXG17_01570 [Chloroflexi bacterium]|nr:hypothetical protein [Chloroflexota bacterium]